MSKRIGVWAGLVGLLVLTVVPAGAQAGGQDQQKVMEMYAKLGAVNEHHDWFKPFAGEWKTSGTMWMYPGSEPAKFENRVSAELILGGRFLKMATKGQMMGQPFDGFQISGYDNLQQKYVVFWIDSTATAFYLTTGTLDPAKQTMTETGLWPDPMSGKQVKVRNVTRRMGPDEFVYESYMTLPNGQEFKTLEQRVVRVR